MIYSGSDMEHLPNKIGTSIVKARECPNYNYVSSFNSSFKPSTS